MPVAVSVLCMRIADIQKPHTVSEPFRTPLAVQRHETAGQGSHMYRDWGWNTLWLAAPASCLCWAMVQNCPRPESPCLKPAGRQEALHCSTAETRCSGEQRCRSLWAQRPFRSSMELGLAAPRALL